MTASETYIALLRGVNVGSRSAISMRELRSLLSSIGLEDVRTYIQSGNVVFRATGGTDELAGRIEREISGAFDVSPAVILRTPVELEAVGSRNPYLPSGADVSKLHVVFLDQSPAASRVTELDPTRSRPDEFTLDGRELFLHLPNGAGRSKLSLDYFERVLDVRGTQRNWNTVLKLIELSRD
jgi:uncharacterized protein (DUF1697 family)